MLKHRVCLLGMVGLVVLVSLALLTACSDRSTNSPDLFPVSLNLKLSSTELASAIDSVRVTIIPDDGSRPIPMTLPVIDGQYQGRIEGVPVGQATLLVQAVDQTGRVIYEKRSIIFVRGDRPTEVEVELEPVVPVVWFVPGEVEVAVGARFGVDIDVHRVPGLNHISFRVPFDGRLLFPDSATLNEQLPTQDLIFLAVADSNGQAQSEYSIALSHTSDASPLTDATGYARLVRLWFTARQPSEVPAITTLGINTVEIHDVAGNVFNSDSVFTSGTTVTIVAGIDEIAPAAVNDLTLDSASTSTAYLSWTASGDDRGLGQATGYDLRYAASPLTAQTWPSATPVTGLPTPHAAGTTERFAVTSIDLVDSLYFALAVGDEVPNWSPLSNVIVAAPTDGLPPSAVTDLQIVSQAASEVVLSWTATGDDSSAGQATLYDVRYSDQTLTDVNFAAATGLSGLPSPKLAGQAETLTVTIDLSVIKHLALRVGDEASNWSGISNEVVTVPLDTISPAAITDLEVVTAGEDSVVLQWTAPGSDGSSGQAATYDLRYSLSPITTFSFDGATSAAAPPPEVPGTIQSTTIAGLTRDTVWYFAAKTSDAAGNWSAMSNILQASTPDLTAPATIDDLTMTDYTSDHIDLQWTDPGDDGTSGQANAYELRWSIDSAVAAGWVGATPVANPPLPSAPGTAESFQFVDMSGGIQYFFVLRAVDNRDNWSALNSVVRVDLQVTMFTDAVLESRVRNRLGITSIEYLLVPDMLALDSLIIDSSGVSTLDGLEHAANLVYLSLDDNMISDIGPLGGLIGLKHLGLRGNSLVDVSAVGGLSNLDFLNISMNQVEDMAPLSGLAGLDTLWASYNYFTDLAPMASLTQATHVNLGSCDLVDLTALAGLASVRVLDLYWNNIVDISPLQGLTTLDTVGLTGNSIADIGALVNNTGLQSGDYINLLVNSLSGTATDVHIPALEARGVIVIY